MASIIGGAAPVVAQESDSGAAQRLAERFAPVLMLKQQDAACDATGEPYRPGLVEVVLDNPEVALRQVGGGDPVVMRAPGAADLAGLNQGFYLDFPGSSLSPGCVYERDFWKYTGERPAAVYAHIVQPDDDPGRLFLQYWFYWYYNDWNNKHESDWEGITLEFEATSVDEALAGEPIAVGYSQHDGGERADWDDDKLERDGDHPFVYASAGSHASYFGSAVHLGRGSGEGFGCDTTTGPSNRVEPEVVVLPDAVDDRADPLAWLAYNGRWGERQNGAFDGPTGPAAKARWLDPAPWFDDLRDASVVIPAGESRTASLVSVFCDLVERGSRALITFALAPTEALIVVLLLGLLARFVALRTSWDRVDGEPIRRRRRAGQIVRAAAAAYAHQPAVFVMFGLVYLPTVAAAGLVVVVLRLLPFVDAFMSLVGGASGTNLVVALLLGSFVHLAAFFLVNSMVAVYLEGGETGLRGGVTAARRTWAKLADIAGAFVRAYGIVVGLLLTTIGAPIGVIQLVRYQFVPQVVMLEDTDGTEALRRSRRLVRGRWLHTAVVAAGLNGLVMVVALGVGLMLLVFASEVPLWAYSVITAVIYAVLVPVAAISMTLLYGDAVAEHEGAPAAAPLPLRAVSATAPQV